MKTIDEYLDSIGETQKTHLERIRKIANSELPDGEEAISYGMPTIRYKGKNIIHFAAFKDHMSIYPSSGEALQKLGHDIDKFRSSKGTLKFTEADPVPEQVIRDLINIRKSEIK